MLEFENQMLLDLLHEDGLLICAKGLGLDNVFFNLIKAYCDTCNLVLILGTDPATEKSIITQLQECQTKPLPHIINSDVNTNDRRSVYLSGGVMFITSRILVVDLLTERIPIDLITGIILYKCHNIAINHQDAFILRLYRQKNKTGFIKGLSSNPGSFINKFNQLSRVMKSLFVKNLYLYPRFEALVAQTLESLQPEVIELQLRLTPKMSSIQDSLIDLLNFCVKELKHLNPMIDGDILNLDNVLTKDFQRVLHQIVDPVWHQLSPKTWRLVADIKTLKLVAHNLTQHDCVTFYNMVSSLMSAERALKSSEWIVMDAAENLFVMSGERVFGTGKNKQAATDPSFDINPKWLALSEVVQEVGGILSNEGKTNQEEGCTETQILSHEDRRILVVTRDDRTAFQVKEFLCQGSQAVLESLFNKSLRPQKIDRAAQTKSKVKEGSLKDPATSLKEPFACHFLPESNAPMVVVMPVKNEQGQLEITRVLYSLRPRCVIMYDCDMTFIRKIEVYQAYHPEFKVRVYFLIYRDSIEEQAYLTTLRREKEAFEALIKEKASLTIPVDQDGKVDDYPDLIRDNKKASETALSLDCRSGGVAKKEEDPRVIVDMREFRSDLPSLLHRKGIEIDPLTIEIGDYILTPDICVERKSLSDLIGSLNSGRLYNQASAMVRTYKHPMLLIEFDEDKPFSLQQGRYYLSRGMSTSDITNKLLLLTMNFPQLRLLWSPSPHASAQLFFELKVGQPQPDPGKIVTSEDEMDSFEDKYNKGIQSFLLKLPGINSKNQYRILRNVESLPALLSLSKEELIKLFENTVDGTKLFDSLHGNLSQLVKPQVTTTRKRFKRRK